MKKTTKLLSLLIAAVTALSALCVTSSAASAYTEINKLDVTYNSNLVYTCPSGFTTSAGTNVSRFAYCFEARYNAEIKVALNKKYSQMTGVLATGKSNSSSWTSLKRESVDVAIYGDGKLLKSYKGINYQSGDINVKLDVTGVKELKVVSANQGDKWGGYVKAFVFLGNCKFQKNMFTISDSELKLDVKGSAKLGFTYKDGAGKNITTGRIKYASEDNKIAKVSSKGKIVGVSAGVTNVTVTTPDGLVEKCRVIVLPKQVTGVKVVSSTSDSVTVEWDKVEGAESYEVGIIDPDLDEYEKQTNVKKTKATIKNLESSTEYTIMVRARIKDGSKYYKGTFSDGTKAKTAK